MLAFGTLAYFLNFFLLFICLCTIKRRPVLLKWFVIKLIWVAWQNVSMYCCPDKLHCRVQSNNCVLTVSCYSLSLSHSRSGGGGSPPQSAPGTPRGVVDPCWIVLPAKCLFWPGRELDTGAPGALPSRQRRCSVDRWRSPGARSGGDS